MHSTMKLVPSVCDCAEWGENLKVSSWVFPQSLVLSKLANKIKSSMKERSRKNRWPWSSGICVTSAQLKAPQTSKSDSHSSISPRTAPVRSFQVHSNSKVAPFDVRLRRNYVLNAVGICTSWFRRRRSLELSSPHWAPSRQQRNRSRSLR